MSFTDTQAGRSNILCLLLRDWKILTDHTGFKNIEKIWEFVEMRKIKICLAYLAQYNMACPVMSVDMEYVTCYM